MKRFLWKLFRRKTKQFRYARIFNDYSLTLCDLVQDERMKARRNALSLSCEEKDDLVRLLEEKILDENLKEYLGIC